MLFHGSAINIVAGLAGLLLFTSDAPAVFALAAYFGAVPYNVFLLFALWRTTELSPTQLAAGARLIGVVWFLVMFVI
jgi:hypothetical protein